PAHRLQQGRAGIPAVLLGGERRLAARALAVDLPHCFLASQSRHLVYVVPASMEVGRRRPFLDAHFGRPDARRSEDAGGFRRTDHARPEWAGDLRDDLYHRAWPQGREYDLD